MKSARSTITSIAITFVAAVVFYALAYSWLSRKQVVGGPWIVAFTNAIAGAPAIVIHQPQLGVSNVTVQFVGAETPASNGTGRVIFDKPKRPLPFGEVIHDDLMFLPGVVTLDLFGHEVELQRALILNRQRFDWKSGATYSLFPTNRLPEAVRKTIKGAYRR
jgi:hypothetical protein